MMKKAILLMAIGLMFSAVSYSQNIRESEQIMVRVTENIVKSSYSKILINYGEGETEEIQLEKIGAHGKYIESHSNNMETINKVLLNIRNAGYELVSSTGSHMTNDYFFVKKED